MLLLTLTTALGVDKTIAANHNSTSKRLVFPTVQFRRDLRGMTITTYLKMEKTNTKNSGDVIFYCIWFVQ